MRKQLSFFVTVFAMAFVLTSCNKAQEQTKTIAQKERKIGVLLVNHGSVQKSWRDMLLDVEHRVDKQLLAMPNVKAVRTAFNEYTEPSVATRMKEFDDQGFDEVIVLPLFLTVGGHTDSDIPNLVGIKNDAAVLEGLPKDGIPVYRPRVKVTLLSTLDSTHFLKENILRRAKLMLKGDDGKKYGLTLAAYGDDKFNQQWEELMADIGNYLKEQVGIDTINYAWSGHLVNYSIDPTRKAVNQILAKKQKDIVVAVYVAFDKQFQQDIIGGGVKKSDRPQDVLYNDTEAILPDQNLNDWVVNSIKDTLSSRQLASR
jgi:CbiX